VGIRRVLRLRAALKRTSALAILSALALPLPAAAQSVWGGSGSTSATTNYSSATNWSNPPGVAPISPGTSAVFANSGSGSVSVSAAVNPDSWTFATNAQNYAITGGSVTFNTGTGLIDDAGQLISIATSLGGAGAQLQLNGSSTLILSGINTYTGATTINLGATLALSGFGSISSSSVVTANGTFDISGSSPFNPIKTLAGSGVVQLGNNGLVITAGSTEFSGTIAGAGGIEIFSGTQTLSGVNTYTNATQIDPGATLALKGNGSIANSAFVSFSPGGSTSHFDISQTHGGASVAGLFDPIGIGVVSLGSKTLTFTSNVGFFNGVIQDGGIGGGTGGNVTIANGGLATFGGVNTYTGFTTINAGGELDMSGNGSIAASKAVINNGIFDISCLCSSSGSITSLSGGSTGVVNLGANTLTITNGNGTYAGAILDSGLGGGLAITGGKEVLTGASSYTGATTITGAALEVDGSLNGTSGVTVNSGGMLSGTGTIDPPAVTINSGATLAPGNAANPFGALTITGTLLFNAGSFYAINIAPGAGNNSKTAVIGSATLGGNGTVVVTPQLGRYGGAVFQILTTTTGLAGTFAGLTVNGNFAGSMILDYASNPGAADLKVSGASLLAPPSGANQNQRNVIGGLNSGIPYSPANTPLPAQFLGLGNLSGPSLLNALTQLDGEAGTGAERAAFQLTNQFLTLMLDPFVDGRQGGFGTAGSGAIGFAPEQQDSLPPDVALAYAAILTKAPPRPTFDQRWTAWGAAYGGSNRTNGDAGVGSNNVTANTFGFAAGMDYHVSPNTIVGFALAGGGTNWGLANELGTGRSDALQAGVYGISYFGPAYIAGALAFTNHWITTNRTALGDQLNANFDGQSYGARLESGYRVGVLPTFGVTPYGALQFQDFHTPAYSEADVSGAGFGLSCAAMNATDVRTELGSRFDAPTLLSGMPLILRGRLAWAHDFVSNPALSAAFETLPGASFTVNGAPIAHDSALTSAGAELFLTPRWTLLAKFDGEFARGSQTYAGSGTLRYSW
jgi:autotransporter-associated beta strand protein